MLRVSDSAASCSDSPITSTVRVAFPLVGHGRHAKLVISELNGWPVCTSNPCHTHNVAVVSVGFEAEWMASPFSYDSFIRYSSPVYPGAFPTLPKGPKRGGDSQREFILENLP